MVWTFVAQMVISMAVTYLAGQIFKEDVKVKGPDRQNLNPDQLPTINEGDVIPVVFGTQKLTRPNIIFYGGFTTEGAGPAGYYYYLTLDLAFCHGPIDVLQKVYWGDFPVTSGYGTGFSVAGSTVTITGSYTLPLTRSTETSRGFCLWAPDLFGGSQREGGTGGGGDLIWGSTTASLVPTYPDVTDPVPSHYGIFRLVLPSWYLGTQPQPKTVAVEVSRYPKLLTSSDYYSQLDGDANPIECIYEIITNTTWGLGMPTTSIDTTNWSDAAEDIKSDGLGCSFVLSAQTEADQVINDLLALVDGIIYSDPTTGKLKVKLIREDYVIADLPAFTESNIISFESSTPWFSETVNEVCVQFVDREADYRERTARSQDVANQAIQGQTVTESRRFFGVSRAPVAQFLSARELRVLSTPLMRVNFKTTRGAWDLKPGDPFKLTWAESGISAKVCRLIKISYGTLEDGIIEIEGIEDAFAVTTGIYTYPGGPTGGGLGTPGNAGRPMLCYLPHEIMPDKTGEYLMAMAKLGTNSAGVKLWLQNDYPSDPLVYTGQVWPGTVLALSKTSLTTTTDLVDCAPSGLQIEVESGTFPYPMDADFSDYAKNSGVTAFCTIATGATGRTSLEWFRFTRAEHDSGNLYTLYGVDRLLSYSYRPRTITADSTRFFFPGFNAVTDEIKKGYGILGPYSGISIAVDHAVKFQSYNALQSQDIDDLGDFAISTTIYPDIPIRPANVKFNGSLYPTTCTGSTVTITGKHRNRLGSAMVAQDVDITESDSRYLYDIEIRTSVDSFATVVASSTGLTTPMEVFVLGDTLYPVGATLRYVIKTYVIIETDVASYRSDGPQVTNFWADIQRTS